MSASSNTGMQKSVAILIIVDRNNRTLKRRVLRVRTLQNCPPEQSEGPAFLAEREEKQILRFAQDDSFINCKGSQLYLVPLRATKTPPAHYFFPYARWEIKPLPSSIVTVWPALTLESLSTCPLGHCTSTLSAFVFEPSPKVSTNSLCDR